MRQNENAQQVVDRMGPNQTHLVSEALAKNFFSQDDILNQYPTKYEDDLVLFRENVEDQDLDFYTIENNEPVYAFSVPLAKLAAHSANFPNLADWLTDAEVLREILDDMPEGGNIESYQTLIPYDELDEHEDGHDYDHPREAYQWFLLTDSWIENRLRERKEILLDNEYGTWWGRQGAGQALYMDQLFIELGEELAN